MGFFDKIKQGRTKTKTKMDAQLTGIFAAYEPGDEEFFDAFWFINGLKVSQ